MYPDPNRVRIHRITVNLDQYEDDVIQSIANYKGIEPAVLLRELAMQSAVDSITPMPAQDIQLALSFPAARKQQ